jgi:CheY-like chemotaxis protein
LSKYFENNDGKERNMPKKILIVEDENDPRVYLDTLLKENGYTTLTAEDGEKAAAKVKDFMPDVILLDILMPAETGVKFYRDLKKDKALGKIPVIICSGATQYKPLFDLDRHALPKPFGFIEKPVDRDELLAKITEALG